MARLRCALIRAEANNEPYPPDELPPGSVILLIENFLLRSKWETTLASSTSHHILDLTGRMDQATKAIQEPLVRELARLGDENRSVEWWCSRLAERNPLVSTLFQDACLVWIACRALDECSGQLVVVSDSAASLSTLAATFGSGATWVGQTPKAPRISIGDAFKRSVAFLGTCLAHRYLSDKLPTEAPDALIHTHMRMPESSEAVRDIYNPGLLEWLTKQNLSVATFTYAPYVRNYRKLVYGMRRSGLNPFPEAKCYRYLDYIYAMRIGYRAARLRATPRLVAGVRLDVIFEYERTKWAFDQGTLHAILRTRLARRLVERQLSPSTVVMEFENMILEKGVILGFRNDSPSTHLIGFQHGALAPSILCQFVRAYEVGVVPLPDRVVCSGPLFRDKLVEAGLPSEMVSVGCALRYSHLFTESNKDFVIESKPIVLVPLPLMISEACELLAVLTAALAELSHVDVRLKPHPMGSVHDAIAALGYSALPDNFRPCTDDYGKQLETASVVVGLASSALVDAAVCGIPVIFLTRAVGLEFNQIAWTPSVFRMARNVVEVRQFVREALNDSTLRVRTARSVLDLRDLYFSPITEQKMNEFLPSNATHSALRGTNDDEEGWV